MTILIPRGKAITDPIDLRMQNASTLLIILEPSSSATIIHGSDPAVHDDIIERSIQFIVHENASLNFHYDETWQSGVHALTNLVIEQQRSSSVHYTHAMSGGARITQRLTLKAIGSDSYADIRGKYLLTGNGSAEMTTLQHHDAPHTKSNLLFKSIVRDTAQMMHHGTIVITKNGAHTESAQHTHALLLGNGARAYSVPNIEVSTHEVQCGHGSAIGRLDEEQLWYLKARGLSPNQAEKLLIDGFFKF
jgi:Fe-S cluster assembly protein SufD